MSTFKKAFDFLILTAPLINFSIIPGSKLPLIYIITIFLTGYILLLVRKVPIAVFGIEDIFYLIFLACGLLSFFTNSDRFVGSKGILQLINLSLTYLIFKISLVLLYRSAFDSETILKKIFQTNSFYAIAGIVVYLIGFWSPMVLQSLIRFLNNSGNFDIGAVGYSIYTARSFGFAPEPSFWSFFLAVNIALGLSVNRPGKFYLLVNFIGLTLTFGRTGFFIVAVILIVKFFKVSIFNKAFLILACAVTSFYLFDFLNFQYLKSVDSSFNQRIDSLFVVFKVLSEGSFLGIGLGNFSSIAKENHLLYFDIFNLFLNLLVSVGIIGLLFFLLALVKIGYRIDNKYNLPFYAAVAGWMTVSAYNLPFIWVIIAALIYAHPSASKKLVWNKTAEKL